MANKRPITQIGDTPRTPMKITAAGLSDKGTVREINEDNYLMRDRLCLWAVADGMGGHSRGDFASETVVEALYHVRPWAQPKALLLDVVSRLEDANQRLRQEAEKNESDAIGSTVVCILMLDREGLVVWAGDSRAYRVRRGEIAQLSKDHSVVEDLVDAGLLKAEDAESHPHAHVLTRAVGAADTLELDFERITLEAGDTYILCSDGLTRVVSDAELREMVATEQHPERICDMLIDLALKRGASDNVTVVSVVVG